MWKSYFSIFSSVVNICLVLLAMWYGIVDKDYAHASFLLLIVVLNETVINKV